MTFILAGVFAAENEQAEEQLIESSVSQAIRSKLMEEEEALINLKAMLKENLKWLVDEQVKADCCLASFNLCEKPPNMTQASFTKQSKGFLQTAKKLCQNANSTPLNNAKRICAFYEVPMDCAYTPNTEQDFQMYEDNLPKCCMQAEAFCKYKDDYDFYLAKKACMGYAARTSDELCSFANSKNCQA